MALLQRVPMEGAFAVNLTGGLVHKVVKTSFFGHKPGLFFFMSIKGNLVYTYHFLPLERVSYISAKLKFDS